MPNTPSHDDARDDGRDGLRASDAEREVVVAALREHLAQGRLTSDEFHERMDQAYAARFLGELRSLTDDLPAAAGGEAELAVLRPDTQAVPTARSGKGARSWLAMSVLLVSIWAMTSLTSGELLYFWPMWAIVPTGVALLAARINGD